MLAKYFTFDVYLFAQFALKCPACDHLFRGHIIYIYMGGLFVTLIVSVLGYVFNRLVLTALSVLLLGGCAEHVTVANTPPIEPSTKYLAHVHPRVVLVLGSGLSLIHI